MLLNEEMVRTCINAAKYMNATAITKENGDIHLFVERVNLNWYLGKYAAGVFLGRQLNGDCYSLPRDRLSLCFSLTFGGEVIEIGIYDTEAIDVMTPLRLYDINWAGEDGFDEMKSSLLSCVKAKGGDKLGMV